MLQSRGEVIIPFDFLYFFLFMNDSVFFFRVTVLDRVTDFLFFLGKLLIVGLVGESICHTLIPPQYLGLARYVEL